MLVILPHVVADGLRGVATIAALLDPAPTASAVQAQPLAQVYGEQLRRPDDVMEQPVSQHSRRVGRTAPTGRAAVGRHGVKVQPPGTGQKYPSTAPLTYRGEWSADELKAAEHAITAASGDLMFEQLRNARARVSHGLRVLRVALREYPAINDKQLRSRIRARARRAADRMGPGR
jgi:hypothetical protein